MSPSRAVPTLQDVARHSGVSISTVSRVLNNHVHIASATRKRVEQAMVELGYAPQRRSATAPAARMIALVTLRATDTSATSEAGGGSGFNDHVRRGASPALEAAGLRPQTYHLDTTARDFLRFLDEVRPSGSLLIGSEVDPAVLDSLVERQHPFVIVGAHVDAYRFSSVMADVLHGTAAAVQHLVDFGRRRVAVVNGPPGLGTHQERYEGWRLGLTLGGVAHDPNLEQSREFTVVAGFEATHDLLHTSPDVDAVLYADDFMALGGLKALAEAGRSVPEDVSVIGFYDYPLAAFTNPSLTSVSVDVPRMGMVGAQMLLAQLQLGISQPWSVRVPTSLHQRGSCRPSALAKRVRPETRSDTRITTKRNGEGPRNV